MNFKIGEKVTYQTVYKTEIGISFYISTLSAYKVFHLIVAFWTYRNYHLTSP